jgi:hypothetical protein
VNLIFTFAISNIDWRAHVGGLITGGLVAAIYAFAPGARRNQLQAAGVVLLMVVMAAGGFLAAHKVNDQCPTLVTQNGVAVACER